MKDKQQGKELVTTTNQIETLKSYDDILAWGEKIVKSQLTPLKEAKDVVVAVLFGRELGMSPMISVNNIYPINGKATLSVHLINGLLIKHGVVIENIRQYEPCIAFAMKGEDDKAVLQDENGKVIKRNGEGNIPDGVKAYPVILREGFADEPAGEFEIRGNKITNYKTVIKLTRTLRQPDGSYRETSVISSYSINEASIAELTGKDNWKKYPKQMCHARALAFGARMIADDLMNGMYETSELADASNINYNMTEEGKVTIIKEEAKNSINTHNTQTISEVEEVSPENSENKNTSNINN